MSAMEIRAFNAEGLRRFGDYLGTRTNGKPMAPVPPPRELLADDALTVKLGLGRLTQTMFPSKFDLAMSVAKTLGKDNIAKLLAEPGVWPWLSLYFSPSTFPMKDGLYEIGSRSRHVVERIAGRNQDHGHRHLVRGGVVAVQRFGQHARVLLGPSSQHTKIEEQVMSRTIDLGLATSAEFARFLYRLYWDPKKNAIVRGAKGEGRGSIMRVIEVMTHLDVTYDIRSLSAEQIEQLLPPGEFKVAAQ